MSTPIDTVLAHLPDAIPNGRDRWRCACPVCGGGNRSTLSVGIGDTGCVLLKCWKTGCGPDEIAAAVGIDFGDLFPARPQPGGGTPPLTRRRMLTAQQALDLLNEDALTCWLVGKDEAAGKAISAEAIAQRDAAVKRIGWLREEMRR